MNDNENNIKHPKAKAKKEKPKVLACRHCFAIVKNKKHSLKSHLGTEHNIHNIMVKPHNIRKHFCLEIEVKGIKRKLAKQKSKRARILALRVKNSVNRWLKRLAQLNENRNNGKVNTYEKDFHCGDVINGAPYARIMYTPIGGLNKKY